MFLRTRLLRLTICSFALAAALIANLSAQQTPVVAAPHKHALPVLPFTGNWHNPPVQRSMVGGMWMIDPNFKSSIYIKNSVKVAPMTVTPILYLSNGQRFQLADVNLEPAGIAVVNINQALADKGIAPWATLRGYVEIQYMWPWDALCVTIRNVDVVHSVVFTHNLRPAKHPIVESEIAASQLRTYEGMWWKQDAGVTGFVSVSNPSASPVSAKIQVSDDRANVLGAHAVTVSAHGTKVVDLLEMQTASASQGVLRVTYEGAEGELLLSGALEDPATGYSANLQFRLPPKPSDKPAALTYAALGLMTGEADPMMRFPAGTRFTPYFLVRNLSGQPYSIRPRLYWEENSTSRNIPLPAVSVPPYTVVNLNLGSMISGTSLMNFNGSLNLTFDFQGQPGSLQLSSGSVDQKNTYVFQVSPQAIGESAGKGLSYWSIANGDDTMITLWNPADEEQDFVFTLFFPGGHYKYPMHLGPKATRSFDISEIIQTQVPDDEGNVIPPSVHEGSAEIAGPEGETQPILVAVDAGVFNAQKATCVPICIDCSGVASAFIDANPFAVKVGGTTQQTFTLQYKSGTQSNATSAATWGSSNSSVGTVKAGLVTGVSPGSLNLSASLYTITQTGEVCQPEQDGPPSCGESLVSAPQAPGTSTPTVTFSGVPASVAVGQTATMTATVSPASNTTPISLSITSPAAIVTPTGTFTKTTTVTLKGMSAGTATITATVSASEGPSTTVGSTSFPVVAPVPTSLSVISFSQINLASFPGCTSLMFGAAVSINYQVLDQNGAPLQSDSMVPQEEILDDVVNEVNYGNTVFPWVNIGPNPGMTSQYTNANGQFWDTPFGVCTNGAFVSTFTQPISILLSGINFTVRNNDWTVVSTLPNHGSISNGSDVSASN